MKAFRIMLPFVTLLALAVVWYYSTAYGLSGPEECQHTSSISCDQQVYMVPLIGWSFVLGLLFFANVWVFFSSWRRPHKSNH